VETGVDLGASPRAIICWGRLANVYALLVRRRDEVYPEDIQDLAQYVLGHRIWLGPHAASHGLTPDAVVKDVIEKVDSVRRPGRRQKAEGTRQKAQRQDKAEAEHVRTREQEVEPCS
jgi:hypothetical protein